MLQGRKAEGLLSLGKVTQRDCNQEPGTPRWPAKQRPALPLSAQGAIQSGRRRTDHQMLLEKQQDDKEQEGILGERMEQLLLGQKTTHRTATDPERSNRRCSIHLKHRNDALKNTQDGN